MSRTPYSERDETLSINNQVISTFDGLTYAFGGLDLSGKVLTYIPPSLIGFAPLAGPTFIGTVTLPSVLIGIGGTDYGTPGQVLTSNGSGGSVTWSSVSYPVFQIHGSSGDGVVSTGTSGLYKLVDWDTPTIDAEKGSFGWNATNSNYVVPLNGNYRVSIGVQWQSLNIENRGVGCYIFVNGSQYKQFCAITVNDVAGSPEYSWGQLSIIIPCSQGDTIDVRSDATTNLKIFNSASYLNVEHLP